MTMCFKPRLSAIDEVVGESWRNRTELGPNIFDLTSHVHVPKEY